jgi:early secretory antigenic target protein ESAT-6
MSRYQVDSDEVLGTSSAIRASITRIQTEVANLHGQVVNLQGSWTGQASFVFQSAASEWNATAQQVQEQLTALNEALGHAGQQYADIEATNTRMFAR